MTPELYSILRTVLVFGVGFLCGLCIAVLIVSLMVTAHEADEDMDALRHWRE